MEIWIYNHYNDQREVIKTTADAAAIGRDETSDVVLRSPFVSRKHARIFKDTGSFFVESLSLNETTVANRSLQHRQKRKIEYGDEIRIGEFSLYMMEGATARRVPSARRAASERKRVIDLEQKMHAELLERLNLRVTGSSAPPTPSTWPSSSGTCPTSSPRTSRTSTRAWPRTWSRNSSGGAPSPSSAAAPPESSSTATASRTVTSSRPSRRRWSPA